jgi:hypothetical protein
MFMKRDRILGILWAVYCSYGSFNLLQEMLRLHPTDQPGLWGAWFALALLCLIDLAGIVASVFLFRSARWARWFVGSLAVFVLFSGIAYSVLQSVLQKPLPVFAIGPSVFALASVVILLLPRHEPFASSVAQHEIS